MVKSVENAWNFQAFLLEADATASISGRANILVSDWMLALIGQGDQRFMNFLEAMNIPPEDLKNEIQHLDIGPYGPEDDIKHVINRTVEYALGSKKKSRSKWKTVERDISPLHLALAMVGSKTLCSVFAKYNINLDKAVSIAHVLEPESFP